MYQRIIETAPKYPDVYVRISDTFGEIEMYACGSIDGTTSIITETASFDNLKSACRYIKDFSTQSANEWCEQNEIVYDEQ